MKKSRYKFLKIVDEKHDINFHWPYIFTSSCLSEYIKLHVSYIKYIRVK